MRIIIQIITAFALSACAAVPTSEVRKSEILKPERSEAQGKFRWLAFNKKQFVQAPGDVMPMSTALVLQRVLGAQNVKQVPGIYGVTFETAEPIMWGRFNAMGEDGWEIQPEYWHGILQSPQPYIITPYKCPEARPCPVCPGPVDPGPGPGPIDPGPGPNPEPEPSKSWGVTRLRGTEAKRLLDTSKVIIGVIDTGIDLQHPLNGRIVWTKDRTGKGSVQDGNGHGTHVAGTIAGRGGYGMSNAQLAVCKGLTDQGSGSSSMLSGCLIDVCSQPGIGAVSNSWGSSQSDPAINQAVRFCTQKGIYVIVAAGNDSGPVNHPAKLAASDPNVIAVAASDQSDRITSFSSRGPEIRAIAPGAAIASLWPGGGTRPLDGTSMATPGVAGVCAYGLAKGIKPCFKTSGTIAGYPVPDAALTAQ